MINLIFQGRTTAAHQKLIDGLTAEGAQVIRRAKGFQRSRRDRRVGAGGLAGAARYRAARRHALVHHGGGRGGGGSMSAAIVTRYHGPTNTKGARISARTLARGLCSSHMRTSVASGTRMRRRLRRSWPATVGPWAALWPWAACRAAAMRSCGWQHERAHQGRKGGGAMIAVAVFLCLALVAVLWDL
jgi:hypothetical protein